MAPWLRFLEAYMVQALLRTPAFHRGVEKVAKHVHRIRNGLPREEAGGTNLEREGPGFIKHFYEEMQGQLGRAEKKEAGNAVARQGQATRSQQSTEVGPTPNKSTTTDYDGADAAWQHMQKQQTADAPKQGFMGEYIEALRDQLKGGKPPR